MINSYLINGIMKTSREDFKLKNKMTFHDQMMTHQAFDNYALSLTLSI